MEQKFLQIGDVFYVTYGMKIYCTVGGHETDRYVYPNTEDLSPMFDRIATEHSIPFVKYAAFMKFLKEQYELTRKDRGAGTQNFVGYYVVTQAHMDGGGPGHGPHDTRSNGHHVFARKLKRNGTYDPNGSEIHFYQSGGFTAVNEDVPVDRKMAASFV